MDSLPRGVHAVQFHNRISFGNYDMRSAKVTSPSCHHAPAPTKSYENFMHAAYLRVQIRNLMSSRKKIP